MTDLIKQITDLTSKWYSLIGPDHHKDRDCHWRIETKWSYGDTPKYFVQHWGYIIGDIEEEFPSYEEALKALKGFIECEIQEYVKYRSQE